MQNKNVFTCSVWLLYPILLFSWWVTQTWLNLGVVAMVEVKWFCFLSRRGRDLKKQHEQRVYEREMHRITLPLSAFANPTCELVDENTIVITAEPNNQTPTQEPVEGADPLMGTAGTPGAWWRNRMSLVKSCLCCIAESQRTKPHVHLPSACRLFSLYLAFTARFHSKGRAYALRERWNASFFFGPRQCPYFLNNVVGESRPCGDTLEKVKWWSWINMHVRDSRGEKLQVHFVNIITGHELSLLVKLQWDGDSPVNCFVSYYEVSMDQIIWSSRVLKEKTIHSYLLSCCFCS